MAIFFAFLFFLIGLLAYLFSPFLLLLSLLLFLYLYFYRLESFSIYLLFLSLFGFLLLFILPKGDESKTILDGICIARKNSYYVLLTFSGKYLIPDTGGETTLFSLVHLEGKCNPVSFTHYESIFNFKDYLKTQGVFYQFEVKKTTYYFHNPISNTFLKNYALSFLHPESKTFFSSLLCGDSLYDLEENKALGELGILSALSLSGFHISFFLNLPKKFLNEKQLKRYPYFELIFICFFLFFSNYRYAIRRIFLLRIVHLICDKSKYKLSYINQLSLVAFVMLIIEPYSILSGSFYYPFPLLFTLALFPEKKKGVMANLRFMGFILLFYLPYRLYQSPSFHLLSPFFQILIIPFGHLLFILGLLLFVFPPIGIIFNYPVMGLLNITKVIGGVPFSINGGNPPIFFVIIYYLLLAIYLILKTYNFSKEKNLALYASLIFFSLTFIPDYLPHYKVTFIDVGQGDCTLIQYGRFNLLIDTGGNKKVDIANDCLIPYFKKNKISHLDAIIITHPDFDHYGALEPLKASFDVRNVFWHDDFLKEQHHKKFFSNLAIEDLNSLPGNNEMDNNSKSGVYLFQIHQTSFLIMGDAPKEIEENILKEHPSLDIDILKVGHHGSNTSSSKNFLKTISPKLAIISCGEKNSYGHPHKEVIFNLESLHIPYRRTDTEGTICLYC